MDKNLSEFVPHKKLRKPVPSVYTEAEQNSVLENFSDETSASLRDHAITLIALKLGVRSGDISNLKISDVDFRAKKITFVQGKNGAWHQSELLPEIEEAMVNYLNNGCPSSGLPNVFLSEMPPIRPMTTQAVHDLTSAALDRAGVEAGERKKGAHAWRSTLSSELVSERASHALVSEALGHMDLASSKNYVKYDCQKP
jgi:integrase